MKSLQQNIRSSTLKLLVNNTSIARIVRYGYDIIHIILIFRVSSQSQLLYFSLMRLKIPIYAIFRKIKFDCR